MPSLDEMIAITEHNLEEIRRYMLRIGDQTDSPFICHAMMGELDAMIELQMLQELKEKESNENSEKHGE
jgi:hypothetical protein